MYRITQVMTKANIAHHISLFVFSLSQFGCVCDLNAPKTEIYGWFIIRYILLCVIVEQTSEEILHSNIWKSDMFYFLMLHLWLLYIWQTSTLHSMSETIENMEINIWSLNCTASYASQWEHGLIISQKFWSVSLIQQSTLTHRAVTLWMDGVVIMGNWTQLSFINVR
jgi:hypothetical protein